MHVSLSRALTVLAAVAVMIPASASLAEDSPPPAPASAPAVSATDPCPVRYRQFSKGRIMGHREYARAVYRRERVSGKARRLMRKMAACAYSEKAAANMRALRKAEARARAARKLAELRAAREAARWRPHAHLRAIAQCESGGNPRAISPGGKYRGKYQFDFGTWASVGGSGDPAAASEAEQDKRAMILYSRRGAQPWPVCGR